MFKVAIAGNPNSGKSSIFNTLTGARQKIGNWPGVTVEKKEGHFNIKEGPVLVVDLPGIYSLSPHSLEERIAYDFITTEKPDLVVNVVDASNLERHLYLTIQLIETHIPVILVLNMMDLAETGKLKIEIEKLGTLCGCPVIPTVARTGRGISELADGIRSMLRDPAVGRRHIHIPYHRDIENALSQLEGMMPQSIVKSISLDTRWLAMKLLEQDSTVSAAFAENEAPENLAAEASALIKQITQAQGSSIRTVLTNWRYGFINGLLAETVTRETDSDSLSLSRRIDLVLTNKYLGLPIFFFLLFLTFKLTFDLGQIPMDLIDRGVASLATYLNSVLAPGLLQELLVDGILSGVGGIAVFLPNIFILFFLISFMEDSGYMARAAFIMDRIMHAIGLHGKAFIPMIMGFGCNVPAIVGTRILESERDRILSILINPLISCSARLPVYILLTGAFFPEHGALVILFIYSLGIALAIGIGKLFSRTILKGDGLPFVMELPPYLAPGMRSLALHTWERGSLFIRKMGSVILFGSILIWSFSAFPREIPESRNWQMLLDQGKTEFNEGLQVLEDRYRENIESISGLPEGLRTDSSMVLTDLYMSSRNSLVESYESQRTILENGRLADIVSRRYLGRIGRALEPVMQPIGIDWQGSVALIVGFVAKEFVVSTYSILMGYGSEEESRSKGFIQRLRNSGMTPLTAFVFMIFTLIYTPCLATLAAIKQETNSWKWPVFSAAYSLSLAWMLSFTVYQIGSWAGIGV